MIKWEMFFSVAREGKKSFGNLILRVMGKAADLLEFDRKEIAMDRNEYL